MLTKLVEIRINCFCWQNVCNIVDTVSICTTKASNRLPKSSLVLSWTSVLVVCLIVMMMLFFRSYVQPQWVFDCVNWKRLLPVDDYAPGEVLPPHLSPFVEEGEDDYMPPEKAQQLEAQAQAEEEEEEEEDMDQNKEGTS